MAVERDTGNSGITIRLATLEDLDQVQRLVNHAFERYIARIGRRPAPMDANYESLIEQGETSVAVLDSELVGVLVLEERSDHLFIDVLGVAPHRQGEGIGAQLLDHAERLALSAGLPELRLCTNQRMTENLIYYPKRGFTERGRGRSDGYDRVFYRKPLSTPCAN